ncbi:MAG TPA: hypothetical protein VFQ44_02050 [Streptosporangiaceae bacterium]|nr:hypothetical protein [Streptosporangiaceae bacterium]
MMGSKLAVTITAECEIPEDCYDETLDIIRKRLEEEVAESGGRGPVISYRRGISAEAAFML